MHCTLSLLRSSIRKSPIAKNGDVRAAGSRGRSVRRLRRRDPVDRHEHADRDPGVFPWHEQDGRFLPFEGAGAISTWSLELAKDYPGFDYETIKNVVIHIDYTARQGVIVKDVIDSLDELFQQTVESGPNLSLLFELQRDFPAAWASFATGPGPFERHHSQAGLPVLRAEPRSRPSGIELLCVERGEEPRGRQPRHRDDGSRAER